MIGVHLSENGRNGNLDKDNSLKTLKIYTESTKAFKNSFICH